jgi:hypothetical protein
MSRFWSVISSSVGFVMTSLMISTVRRSFFLFANFLNSEYKKKIIRSFPIIEKTPPNKVLQLF